MKILNNFFPYALPAREVKAIYLIFLFMVLTILYYFLRFQFGQPSLFAIAQASILAFLGLLAAMGLLVGNYRLRNALDFVLFLFLAHASVFCVLTVFRDGTNGAGWAVMTSLLPILVYFYVGNVLSPVGASRVLMLLEFILLAVAIIAIAEFISLHVLNAGYFNYSDLMNEHAQDKGADQTSRSWAQGDLYTYVRMPGSLGHNNTTGLALALGLVLSVTRYVSTRKVLTTMPFILVFAVALILGGGRTSILAGMAGALTAATISNRISLIKALPLLLLIAGFVFLTINRLIAINVIDLSAFGQIYSIEQSANTLEIMLTEENIQKYFQQVLALPFVLFTGVGPATPDMPTGTLLSPILSEDFFIISILSRYGILLPVLLGLAVWMTFRKALRDAALRGDVFLQSLLAASFGCVVAFVVSIAHTNALMWPQLFPIFFICLAIISVVGLRHYKET